MVLPIGSHGSRLPRQQVENITQRKGVSGVEPMVGRNDAARDGILDEARLAGVVRGQDGLPSRDLPSPGIIGDNAITG